MNDAVQSDLISLADAVRELGVTRGVLYHHASRGRLELVASTEGRLQRLVSRAALQRLRDAGWLESKAQRIARAASAGF